MNIEIEKVTFGFICTIDTVKYAFKGFEEMMNHIAFTTLLTVEGKSKNFAGSKFGKIEVKYTTDKNDTATFIN